MAVGIIALVLVTVGIDATDHYDNMSESLVGRLVLGESEGPCSEDMVYISSEYGGFCIDKYEASPGKKCPENIITTQADTRNNLDTPGCGPESVLGKVPWRFVSQAQAAQACAKAGKRLPTDEEWYQASLGTPDPENNWGKDDCHVDKNWGREPGLTGTGVNCVSSSGASDMIGNVWEWVKGEAKEGLFKGSRLPEAGYVTATDSTGSPIETNADQSDPNYNEDYFWLKTTGVRGMARGGYWENKEEAGMYAVYLVSPPSFAGTGIGFRCAK